MHSQIKIFFFIPADAYSSSILKELEMLNFLDSGKHIICLGIITSYHIKNGSSLSFKTSNVLTFVMSVTCHLFNFSLFSWQWDLFLNEGKKS